MGVEIRAFFSVSKDLKQASSKSKGTSLASKFVRGLAIEKNLL
jgi:hypothetical protein